MLESSNYNRIWFAKKGTQRDFILQAKNKIHLPWIEFAKKLEVSQRTLADWKREKFKMSHRSAQLISTWTKISIPKDYIVIDWKAHMREVAKIGGRKIMSLYGSVVRDEAYRKDKWKKWWEEIGKYKKPASGFQTLVKIKIQKKSKILAEFIGILLGDGHITLYQVGVTLSSEEREYIVYVSEIIKKLFDSIAIVSKRKDSKAVVILVSRKSLVNFCQEVGFKAGNKVAHQVDIPHWIKENKDFSRTCVRGLVDTDGCFYRNSYVVNGKMYMYFKIAFVSGSVPLLKSFQKILSDLGIISVIVYRKVQKGGDVRIIGQKDVAKYIKIVGSSNQKHITKIKDWKDSFGGDGRSFFRE